MAEIDVVEDVVVGAADVDVTVAVSVVDDDVAAKSDLSVEWKVVSAPAYGTYQNDHAKMFEVDCLFVIFSMLL